MLNFDVKGVVMPIPDTPIISLLTDFGLRDYYVGAVKGTILKTNTDVHIVDMCHDITPFSIQEAAFMLYCYYSSFPERTIHMAVVDPGVGTSRSSIFAATHEYYFAAPDNGILSYILEMDEVTRAIRINAEHYFEKNVSNTFHARDIFAPCVAWKAKGIELESFGDPIEDLNSLVRFDIPQQKLIGEKLIKGQVMHIDRFGNIITNISNKFFRQVSEKNDNKPAKLIIAGKEINSFREDYTAAKGQLFFLEGGSNHLEIATFSASAQAILKMELGKEVGVMFS